MACYRRGLLALSFLFGTTVSCVGQAAVEKLSKLYVAGQMDAVVEQGRRELAAHPEQPLVHMIVGRAYADRQQFWEAVPHLTQSLIDARTPTNEKAWSKAYLGTCYYGLQRYSEARQALEEVVAQAATKNVTSYATQRLSLARAAEIADRWETLETRHFRFRFQNPSHIPSLQAYVASHERAYELNNQFFKADLPSKIDFFVWDNGLEAQKILGQELGFTQPYMLTIHVLPNQTHGHEITHMLTHYGLQPIQKTRLINEGVAVYFDQTNRNRLQEAREQISGPIDIWKMWEHPELFPPKEVYAVGGALLEYLLAHASEAEVKQLLREQTPQIGHMLVGRQVAELERELSNPTTAKSLAPLVPARPRKLTAAQVDAVVEQRNAADNFYKVLILLNGVPVTSSFLQQQNPEQIQDVKILKSKEEIRAYTEVELSGIILITRGK